MEGISKYITAGADPGFVDRGAQRLPRAPQARRFLEGPV